MHDLHGFTVSFEPAKGITPDLVEVHHHSSTDAAQTGYGHTETRPEQV
jgi:hypothetical protein